MLHARSLLAILPWTLLLTACGGGGGGDAGGMPAPPGQTGAPHVIMSAYPASVRTGESASIGWSATGAERCTASGGWSGPRETAGSEATGALTAATTFVLTCTGPGGSAEASASVAIGAAAPDSRYPLHVEKGQRFLVDARGQPFLVHGDTAWSLIVELTREQADQYLEDRRLKGFNTVLVNLIEHRFSTNPPKNVYGDDPFTVPGDFSTPNEAYFAHAEYVISKAAEKGMLVMLAPAYMGFEGGDEGWYQEMSRNGASAMRTFGRYVANRFRQHDNILWVQGGDYNPPNTELLHAVADGIRDVDTRWLQTFHGGRGTAALQFVGTSAQWLTVNDIYTDENTVVAAALQEYARSTMPFFLIESRYEGESASAQLVRTQAYQAVLSGATGQLMGNSPIWKFGSDWQQALASPAARTLAHLRELFDSVAWWTLQPDTGNEFLTAGAGSGAARAVAAYAGDGSFTLAYTPGVHELTLNLDRLSGPNVQARWYDPTSGAYTTAAGSPLPASGSHTFVPAGNNADGDSDWVLLLESQP